MTNPKALEIEDVQANLRLGVGPRYKKPITDDVVLTVSTRGGHGSRSILLTRARATELHEWLGVWLEHGWDGVKQEDGESTAEVIDHFRDIAIRHRIDLDHARSDFHRDLDAALALIPAELRTVELTEVAAEQSRIWHRQQAERDGLERFRLGIISLLFEMGKARGLTGEQALNALQKTVDKYNHPRVDDAKLPTSDAPIYDSEQLGLGESERAA
jgi:hypothetical protein